VPSVVKNLSHHGEHGGTRRKSGENIMKGKIKTFIDLFAGAGGLSEGFMREGFQPVAFVEKDKDACHTLQTRMAYWYLKKTNNLDIYRDYLQDKLTENEFYNHIPEGFLKKILNEEINEHTIDVIFNRIDEILCGSKVDIILGGPPCQAYSVAGRSRMGEKVKNDNRNYLFKFYIKFLKKYKPSMFIFENVPGLLSADGGRYFEEMISEFEKLEYGISSKILNAADYGVLQNRKRVFIVGMKHNKKFVFPEPDPGLISGSNLKELFCDLPEAVIERDKKIFFYIKEGDNYLKKTWIRNDLDFTTLHITRPINKNDKEIYKLAIRTFMKEGRQLKYTELPEHLKTHRNQVSFIDRFRVLNLDGISHTIVSHLSKDGHYYIYPDYDNPRSLSVREAARIQSFPDDYFFEGSRTSCFRQIGNAVPVLLSQALAKQIIRLLI